MVVQKDKIQQLERQIRLSDREHTTLKTMYMDTLEQLDQWNMKTNKLTQQVDRLKRLVKDKDNLESTMDKKIKEQVAQMSAKVKSRYINYWNDMKKELDLSKQINDRLNNYIEKMK